MLQNPSGGDGSRCLYPFLLSPLLQLWMFQVPRSFQASLSPINPLACPSAAGQSQLIGYKIYVLWTVFCSRPFSPIRCSLVHLTKDSGYQHLIYLLCAIYCLLFLCAWIIAPHIYLIFKINVPPHPSASPHTEVFPCLQ